MGDIKTNKKETATLNISIDKKVADDVKRLRKEARELGAQYNASEVCERALKRSIAESRKDLDKLRGGEPSSPTGKYVIRKDGEILHRYNGQGGRTRLGWGDKDHQEGEMKCRELVFNTKADAEEKLAHIAEQSAQPLDDAEVIYMDRPFADEES